MSAKRCLVLFAAMHAAGCQLDPTAETPGAAAPGGKADGAGDPHLAQLSGRVTNAATGDVIPDVEIVVVGSAARAVTGLDGRYNLSNVAVGTHLVFGLAGQPHCTLYTDSANVDLVAGANTVDLSLAAPPDVMVKNVLVLDFDPILESQGGVHLSQALGWHDRHEVTTAYATTLAMCSGNKLVYRVVDWIDIDGIPVLEDGFSYDDQGYLDVLAGGPAHVPSMADYARVVVDFDLQGRVDRGEIDEVVMWGGPWFGFYESRMVGPSAYWVNAPALPRPGARDFIMMGLNPERGVAEALHSFGHRIESIMTHVYGSWNPAAPSHAWDRFSAYDGQAPGHSGCGNVHFPPNAVADYDYASSRVVASRCGDYAAWPSLQGTLAPTNASTWGGDDYQRRFLEWWMAHLPKLDGVGADGTYLDWWRYVGAVDHQGP